MTRILQPTGMTRRRFIERAAGAAAVGALGGRAAFAQSGDVKLPIVSDRRFEGQTVVVTSQTGPVISGPIAKFGPAWEEATGAKIELVTYPFGQMFEKLRTELATGAYTSDLFNIIPGWAGEFVGAGYLETVPDWVKELVGMDDYYPTYRDVMFWGDEMYGVVYDGNVHVSIASLPGVARRTVTIHSFTKCYGLRAGRIGYAAGNEELIAPVAKAFEWATLTGNPASQAMAWAALVGPQDWIEEGMQSLLDNRDLIRGRLEESELISTVVPQGATFYYLNFSRLGVGEEEFCRHLLARFGVPTVPGASFAGGEMQEGCYLRLPFGGTTDIIERAIRGVQAAAEDAIRGDLVSGPDLS